MSLNTAKSHEEKNKKVTMLNFPNGLIGMEEYKEFVMEENPEIMPLITLFATSDPMISLVAVEPWHVCPGYEFDLSTNHVSDLDIRSKKDVRIINLVVIPDKFEDMTANLRAPIIINARNGLSKQIVLDNKNYPIKHRIMNCNKRKDRRSSFASSHPENKRGYNDRR